MLENSTIDQYVLGLLALLVDSQDEVPNLLVVGNHLLPLLLVLLDIGTLVLHGSENPSYQLQWVAGVNCP